MARLNRVGIGTYRMNFNHESALRHALSSGITTIDTAPNYEMGVSQQLIGNVISDYKRDSFRIFSKVGMLQGPAFESLKDSNQLPLNMVPLGGSEQPELGGFSIHPAFIQSQLQHSLEAVQSDFIDIYFLHNPEILLQNSPDDKQTESQKVFNMYQSIRAAFDQLETEVSRGRIKGYGVSSNVFARSDTLVDPEKLLQIAKEIGGESHHFKAVQFPLNVVEKSKLDHMIPWCKSRKIESVINRPLHAFYEGEMYRLTSPGGSENVLPLSEIEQRRDAILKYAAEKKYEYLIQFIHQLWASVDEFIVNNPDWRIELEGWMNQYSNLGGIDQEGIQHLAKFVFSFCEYLEHLWLQKGSNIVRDKLNLKVEEPLQNFALKWLLNQTDSTILIQLAYESLLTSILFH